MGEYKFRFYSTKTKEMVTGFYCIYLNGWDKSTLILQYLRCHDKYGKEIYEGDIIKFPSNFTTVASWYDMISRGTIYTNKVEVLGNIYENPEILEVQEVA